MVTSFIIGRIGQPEAEPDQPVEYYGPRLSFAASASLDHDLPSSLLTTDEPVPVDVTGSMQLTDEFLAAMGQFGVSGPIDIKATNHASLTGAGVTGDSNHDDSPVAIAQDVAGTPVAFPVDLTATATPTPGGGALQLDYSVEIEMAIDQPSTYPFPLDVRTVSMTCETAGPPQLVEPSEDFYIPEDVDADFRVAAPRPLADSFVAVPDGVIARTDRVLSAEPSLDVDVLVNDEALGADRSIDPESLAVAATEGPIDVTTTDRGLVFDSPTVPFSESPFGGFEGPFTVDQSVFPTMTGFVFNPFARATVTYQVCDDDDPASCAEGLTEVIMPVEIGDPCDDPNVVIDCTPYEPPVDTTCTDDMSICEVPGCTWSDDDDRYVCTYPGKLQADPNDPTDPTDPPSGSDDPPSSNDNPPSGNGPGDGRQPPLGTPLTPAFTA